MLLVPFVLILNRFLNNKNPEEQIHVHQRYLEFLQESPLPQGFHDYGIRT